MASVTPPPNAPERRRPAQVVTIYGAVTPDTCDRLGYGSIHYRDCRATEKKRLLAICKRTQDRADDATGDMRAPMLPLAHENCRVADLYRIVN